MTLLKKISFFIAWAFICAVPRLDARTHTPSSGNAEADKQLVTVITSDSYANRVVSYPYAGQRWDIRIVYTPNGEVLRSGKTEFSFVCCIATKGGVPGPLLSHIQKLIKQHLERGASLFEGTYMNGQHVFDLLKNPTVIYPPLILTPSLTNISSPPVITASQIDDPSVDAKIKEMLSKENLSNQVFHYQLGDICYKVRIIYNPDYLSLQAIKKFRVYENGLYKGEQPFTVSWNHKYGIVVNRVAPRDLIDYLSKLYSPSLWEGWFRSGAFKIYNGTRVQLEFGKYEFETIPWFDFLEGLGALEEIEGR